MKLRQEQIDILQQRRDDEFGRGVCADIRANHPAEAARFDNAALRDAVDTGIARARAFGLSRKATVALFVEIMFMIAPGFHDYPPIRAILESSSRAPELRLDEAVDAMTDADWAAAAKRDDPAWWTQEGPAEASA